MECYENAALLNRKDRFAPTFFVSTPVSVLVICKLQGRRVLLPYPRQLTTLDGSLALSGLPTHNGMGSMSRLNAGTHCQVSYGRVLGY